MSAPRRITARDHITWLKNKGVTVVRSENGIFAAKTLKGIDAIWADRDKLQAARDANMMAQLEAKARLA